MKRVDVIPVKACCDWGESRRMYVVLDVERSEMGRDRAGQCCRAVLRYIRRFRRRKRCEGVVCWAEKLRVYASRETEGEWGRLKTARFGDDLGDVCYTGNANTT